MEVQKESKFKRDPIYGAFILICFLIYFIPLKEREIVYTLMAFFAVFGFWFLAMAYVVVSPIDVRVYKHPLNIMIVKIEDLQQVIDKDKHILLKTKDNKTYKIKKSILSKDSKPLLEVLQAIVA